MCNSVEDVIKTIQTFMELEDIEEIARLEDDTFVIDGSSHGIQHHPDDKIPKLMENFDIAAYCYLLTPEGLINQAVNIKLAKYGMKVVKVSEIFEPIKYAVKTGDYHFLFNS